MRSVHCVLSCVVFDPLEDMHSRESSDLPRFDMEVLPMLSWRYRVYAFRSSLRDALERFTAIAARPCGPRPGMYPSYVLHLILACLYPCSCFCDLFCTCCGPHPCSPPLPSFPSNCQVGHTTLHVLGVTWRRHVFSVSGDVGESECQTIPLGLWSCPSVPWAWSSSQGVRVRRSTLDCLRHSGAVSRKMLRDN